MVIAWSTVFFATVLLNTIVAEEVPTISSSDEISRINSLSSEKEDVPPINLDPRLRRALLRVLTKLEEQDRKKGNQDSARQMAEVMQNIISEEEFIKYFQERGLDKELLNSYESNEPIKQKEQKNAEEILAYSSDDTTRETEKPFTFASYPRDKDIDTTPDSEPDEEPKDQPKYPSTFPTPSLGDAIYFQIPEPIQILKSSAEEEEEEEKGTANIQETRSIQGPTLISPTQNTDQKENSEPKEGNINFVTEQVSTTTQNQVTDTNDNEYELNTQVDFLPSNGTEVEDVESSGNSSLKIKMEKHEVEFLHAPLLAAFTVQQDQQGLPRRVIPLNYQVSGDPITLPNNKDQPEKVTKLTTVEEKQKILQEQVKFLQEQQLQEQEYQRLQQFVKQRQQLLDEEAKRQLLIDNQKQQFENEQRLALARQKQQQILFQNQQSVSSQQEFERQRFVQQQNFQQQNVQHQNIQGFQNQNIPRQNLHQETTQNVNFQQHNGQPENFQQQNLHQQNFNQPNLHQPNFQQENVQNNYQEQRFNNLQQQNRPQDFNFQKSIDFQFQNNVQEPQLISQPLFQPSFNSFGNFQPSLELNRVNRNEPSNLVGNFVQPTLQPNVRYHSAGQSTVLPFAQPAHSTFVQPSNFIHSLHRHRFAPVRNFVAPPPVSLDGQLQSLLSLSGISGGLNGKPNAQEDLNIVSKVLALGHVEQKFTPQRQHLLQQASTKHEQVVEPPLQESLVPVPTPSRVIEPPRP